MRSLLLSLFCFAFALTAAADVRVDPILAMPMTVEFFNHATVRAFFAELLERGGYGHWNTEQAAFIVMGESGQYGCVAWPSRVQYHRSTFDGMIPPRTVAIVHTHPEATPRGSDGDQRTAMRLGVPVFVVTARNIYLVTVDGENVPVVTNQMWTRVSAASSRKCTAPDSRASRQR